MIPTKTETKVFFVYSVNQVAGATWPEDFNFVGVWNDEEDAKEHVKTLNKEVREREGLLGDQFYAMLEEPVDEDDEHAIHEDHELYEYQALSVYKNSPKSREEHRLLGRKSEKKLGNENKILPFSVLLW